MIEWYANTHDWWVAPPRAYHINLDGALDKTIELSQSPYNFGGGWNAPKILVAPESQVWVYKSIASPHANLVINTGLPAACQ